jgi:hypothetical protein
VLDFRSVIPAACLLSALVTAACGGDSLTVPGTGMLEVTTATTGAEPDPDGYTLQVDAGSVQAIGPSASLGITEVSPGDHTVQLAGMAANCTVSGENPRTVTVAAGQTASVAFEVTCGATSGGVQVTTSTSGPAPDPDGYSVTIDGTDRGAIGASAQVNVGQLPPGDHQIGLSGIAANCQVGGNNPQTVTIVAGASATVAFAVTCSAAPANAGTLRVRTATTGEADPDGYSFAVDDGASQPIGGNASVSLANVAAGSHSVRLSGLSSNCAVQGANPQSVTVSAGATAEASFAITCSTTRGTIQVNVATSGSPADPDGFTVKLDQSGPTKSVPGSGGSITFDAVPAGDHTVALTGLAPNCSVADGASKNVSVQVGAVANVAFAVGCTSTGQTWSTIPLPAGFTAFALWAGSPTNLLVAGRNSGSFHALILHYDGTTWNEQFRSSETVTTDGAAFSGSSASDVLAVIGDRQVLRKQGDEWVDVGPGDEEESYVSVWHSSGQRFAGGFISFIPQLGLLSHYDGTTWHESSDHGFDANGVVYDISGASRTSVYSLGEESPSGQDPEEKYTDYRVVHFDGSSWSESHVVRLSRGDNPNPGDGYGLQGLWAIASNDVFAVGSGGHIDHFNGTAWSPMTSPTTAHLFDVWGNSASNVYAVGEGGILHFDGSSWSVINNTSASRVWGTTERVFVLTQGAILHANH